MPLEFEVDGKKMGLEERMKISKANGVSTVIIENFEVKSIGQWGYADAENGVMMDENTLFQMGTLTLPVTSLAVLRTAEAGKLDLDANINDYLTTWKFPAAYTEKKPLTARDILLKRRGFKSHSKPTGYNATEQIPTALQILNGSPITNTDPIRLKKSENKSGNYSWMGDFVLQIVLEDIYGKSYAEVIQELVFDPIGMDESFIATELTEAQKAKTAVGYLKDGSRVKGDYRRYPEQGSSGMWSTPRDYAKLIIEIMKAANGQSDILSEAMAKEALQPQFEGKNLLMNTANNNDNHIMYGGASYGFRTQFHAGPQTGWGIVSFMNSFENWQMMAEFNWQTINALSLNKPAN